jgi:hypothetical protein
MKIIIIKDVNQELKGKSYQMRIEFCEAFSGSNYELQLIEKLDLEWKKIGVYYFWHIGVNFADGFFDDFNGMKISLNEIITNTQKPLNQYSDKILSVTFRDIN